MVVSDFLFGVIVGGCLAIFCMVITVLVIHWKNKNL